MERELGGFVGFMMLMFLQDFRFRYLWGGGTEKKLPSPGMNNHFPRTFLDCVLYNISHAIVRQKYQTHQFIIIPHKKYLLAFCTLFTFQKQQDPLAACPSRPRHPFCLRTRLLPSHCCPPKLEAAA